jgi:hypothetical protein
MARTTKAAQSRITIPPAPSRKNSDVGHIVPPRSSVSIKSCCSAGRAPQAPGGEPAPLIPVDA